MSQPKASKLYALTMFLVVSVLCGLLTAGLAVPLVALAGGTAKAGADSLDDLPAELDIPPQPEGSKIYMANGQLMAEFYQQKREYVPLAKISPVMRTAQVMIEDHRFYEHGAIDLQGTLRALLRNSAGGSTQGGSTLTQQYVKQVLVLKAVLDGDEAAVQAAQEESYARKVRELRYAIALEKKYTKDQILERYLNIAYYGDGAYGVEAAAQHYFKTSAAKLTIDQAAMLAGQVQNPVATNPRLHPEAAVVRRNVVLNRIAELGKITPAQAEKAKAVKFTNKGMTAPPNGCTYAEFPHVCQYVVNSLLADDMTALGKTKEDRENALRRNGLKIQTLIDPVTQRAAERAIAQMVGPTDPLIASSVLVQPKTGLIVAMAQSRPKVGTKAGQTYINYNVEQSMGGGLGFQAGSTFKAFTVAAALEKGMTPQTRIMAPTSKNYKGETFSNCDGSFVLNSDYKVSNSAGGDGRQISMVEGAKRSVNTYFVPLEQRTGICEVTKMADKAGAKLASGAKMQDTMDSFPSFTLGVADVTPLSMASAYATFANRGVYCEPLILKSVTDKSGKALKIPQNQCTKVMEQQVADGTNYVLQQVMQAGGTGVPARIPGITAQAGKTGTTESNEAVWFAGYTPELAGISMIAVDKGDKYWKSRKKTIKYYTVPSTDVYLQGSGGGDAGQIYKAAMAAALKGKQHTSFVQPSDDVMNGKRVQVPPVSGLGYQAAKSRIEQAGFSTYNQYVTSNLPRGTYLGYAYPTGSQRLGTSIGLYFSNGPAPKPKVTKTADPPKQPTATQSKSASPPPSKETTKPGNGGTGKPDR